MIRSCETQRAASALRGLPLVRTVLLATLMASASTVMCAPAALAEPRDARRSRAQDDALTGLLNRVTLLEQRLGVEAAAPSASPAASNATSPRTAPSARPSPTAPARAPAAAQDVENASNAMRALERALVREGGLTLPAWRAELEPRVTYRHAENRALTVLDQGSGPLFFGEEARRSDSGEAGVALRLGLPWRAQVEVDASYLATHEAVVAGGSAETRTSTGIDAIRVGVTKQLLAEKGALPAVLASASYRKALGDAEIDPRAGLRVHGAGFDAAQVSVTAVRTQDPLVFYLTGSYARTFADTVDGLKIRPGDVAGAKAGTILAVSPDTSLSFGLDAAYSLEAEVEGETVSGSDALAATLELGVSTVLSERTLMSVTGGAGLTDAAPDLRLSVSFSNGL